jgi:hypothetical protein
MKLEFSQQIFEKYSNITFDENPSNGSRVFHADRRIVSQTDMMKLIVTFRNFVNGPKNTAFSHTVYLCCVWSHSQYQLFP